MRYHGGTTPSVFHPTDLRASDVTTLSAFVNAGWERERERERGRKPSPQRVNEQLKLVPEDQENAVPTSRGIIEERQEHMAWTASGQKDDRTPVYVYSPKPDEGPLHSNGSSSGASGRARSKSPKKKLLDRFNFTRTKSAIKDVQQPLASTGDIGPKAAAILGTSVSSGKKSITTTPNTSLTKKTQGQQAFTDGSRSSFPVDPASFSHRKGVQSYTTPLPREKNSKLDQAETNARRVVSQPETSPERAIEKAAYACEVARSKSLHYWEDKTAPPTPPTKDTPPELKQKSVSTEAASTSTQSKQLHHGRTCTMPAETPSKQPPALSNGPRLTQDKGDAYREWCQARIVDKSISVESLTGTLVTQDDNVTTDRASIEQEERNTYATLGLLDDGCLPHITYSPSPPSYQIRHVYSPSIYQEDWQGGADAVAGADESKVGKVSFLCL